MKERIIELTEKIKSRTYDNERAHLEYDQLIEDFIKDEDFKDSELLPLIKNLIDLPKDFWYT